jgi:nitrogen fixation NifU-like protein
MTAGEDLSREIILDHYQNPRNHGRLENPTVANRGHNPLCGDEIELSVLIDTDRIRDIAFTGRGCSISQASASMMTDAVKGLTLDETDHAVQRFTQRMATREAPPRDIDEELDALQGVKRYPARVKCALLPWTTLRETVNLYRQRDSAAATVDGPGVVVDCADAP